jgi:hypothetical protein
MALRIRRGTDSQRQTIVPEEGELIFTTDLKQIWVGDGTSMGGVPLTSSGGGGGTWGGIIGQLADQIDLSAALAAKANTSHNHDDLYFTEAEVTTLLTGKADTSHTHDDRYYTETETDSLLAGKASTTHTHVVSDIASLQAALDAKASTIHTHIINDTTGLQTALDGKSNTGHIHDDRYYTEAEIDVIYDNIEDVLDAINGTPWTAHNHDDRYYTETEVDTALALKAADNLVVKLAGAQTITGEKTFSALTTIDAALRQRVPANRQTASYTLVIGDEGKLVETNVASANNLTVPPNSSVAFPVGTQVLVSQYGAGQTTIVAGAGVTLRSSGTKIKLSAQYAIATLIKIATDEWMLSGDLTA